MTFEDLSQPNTANEDKIPEISDSELTGIKNQIQYALMVDFGVTDDESVDKWISEYAEDFSEYIHENLKLADMWKDEDNRQIVLETLIQAEKEGFPKSEKDIA